MAGGVVVFQPPPVHLSGCGRAGIRKIYPTFDSLPPKARRTTRTMTLSELNEVGVIYQSSVSTAVRRPQGPRVGFVLGLACLLLIGLGSALHAAGQARDTGTVGGTADTATAGKAIAKAIASVHALA